MTINEAMATLVAELAEGEVPAPLSARFTLAAVWADLARLAGERRRWRRSPWWATRWTPSANRCRSGAAPTPTTRASSRPPVSS